MARTAPDPLGSRLPLAAAPMAGGPTTPRLAAAVAEAGAFTFLAGGYKTAESLAAEIAEVRRGDAAFGVNLFAPTLCPIDEAEFRRYAHELQTDAERYDLDLSQAPLLEDDDRWQDKLDLLLADPVPVVSVTFGLPRPAEVAALRRAGSQVLVTVTTVDEARAAADVGADALVAQGSAAGGHSGAHDPLRTITPMPTERLTRDVIAATGLPVIAAGASTAHELSRSCSPPARRPSGSAPCYCAPTRAAPPAPTRTRWPIHGSPTPSSPARSPAAQRAPCATGSPTATTPPARPATRPSTTSPEPCARPRPPPGTHTGCTCGPAPASAPPPPDPRAPSSTGSPSSSDHHTSRPRHHAGRRP
jgi:hypothetical protein